MIKTAVLTVSSTRTKENDLSGNKIKKILFKFDFEILAYDIVSDNKEKIKNKLKYLADELEADIVLTTGGTGLLPLSDLEQDN